jgi:hypothetical protein
MAGSQSYDLPCHDDDGAVDPHTFFTKFSSFVDSITPPNAPLLLRVWIADLAVTYLAHADHSRLMMQCHASEFFKIFSPLQAFAEHHIACIKTHPSSYSINQEAYDDFLAIVARNITHVHLWQHMVRSTHEHWIKRVEFRKLLVPIVPCITPIPTPTLLAKDRKPPPVDFQHVAPTGLTRTWGWYQVTCPEDRTKHPIRIPCYADVPAECTNPKCEYYGDWLDVQSVCSYCLSDQHLKATCPTYRKRVASWLSAQQSSPKLQESRDKPCNTFQPSVQPAAYLRGVVTPMQPQPPQEDPAQQFPILEVAADVPVPQPSPQPQPTQPQHNQHPQSEIQPHTKTNLASMSKNGLGRDFDTFWP